MDVAIAAVAGRCCSWPLLLLAAVVARDLHGITDFGNPTVTTVKTAVMGNGFSPW